MNDTTPKQGELFPPSASHAGPGNLEKDEDIPCDEDHKPQMSKSRYTKKELEQLLEGRVLHGLACEWDEAVWILKPQHRNSLRRPLFSVRDMKDKWGYWSRENREICLSRALVLDHSWDSVREILLHEMAHQFADEVLNADSEVPHGPRFREACHLLRANPKASGKYAPLDERLSDESAGSEDKIMIRVKKLMALAESQNRHEAEAAMAKAYKLIAKYNLDLVSKHRERDFLSVFLGKPALRHRREDYSLAHLLEEFYFVHGIWMPAYVLDKGKMGNVLEISGTERNVRLAAYVYDFVRHFIDSQWELYNEQRRLNRHRKTDFALGIIEGFRLKLESKGEKESDKKHSRALVKQEDPLLAEYVAYRYPRIARTSGKPSKHNPHVVRAGKEIGKRLVVYQGITERGRGNRLMIED
jgi:hypothetical protein